MAHRHGQHETKNLKTAFFLNFGFTLIEVIGGLLTNSVSILSDALHDLGDTLSLGLSWYFQKLSGKGRNKKYSYGYGRFSLLGAIINSAVLVAGSGIIIYESIPRLITPEQPDAQGMILLAIGGIIFNGIAVLKLRSGSTLNEEAVSLHLFEDVLGWIAVLIGAIVMNFYDVPVVDPILSLLIAAFILYSVFKNIKKSLRIILQGTPRGVKIDQLLQQIKQDDAVKDIHDHHLWTMDGEYFIFSAHLVVNDDQNITDLRRIKQHVRAILKSHDIEHATLEFETQDEPCELEDC